MSHLPSIFFIFTSLALAACTNENLGASAGGDGGSTGSTGSTGSCAERPSCSGPVQNRPHAVVVDAANNVFVVGEQFDPAASDPADVSVFFVSKRDPSGKELSMRKYGQGARQNQYRLTAALSPDGGLVIAGELNGKGDFDGTTLESIGSGDAFAVLLDPKGDVVWGRTFGTAETVLVTAGDAPDDHYEPSTAH